MTEEAIVLAGGFGTRLKTVVSDIPKPMAPVAGIPFLEYVLRYLSHQGITHLVLAVGHLREQIIGHFGDSFEGMDISYSEEVDPLGTGGGILQACGFLKGKRAFVVNGDTFFHVDLAKLETLHVQKGAALTLALKPMHRFERYGTVETDANGKVEGFLEKQYRESGLINGGVYCLETTLFEDRMPKVFSFEKDVLERRVREGVIYGVESDTYFIDIGIPEDYQKAQEDFAAGLHEA